MIPRPRRVWALCRRELRRDLKGSKGLSIPGLVVALLLPASMLPAPTRLQESIWVSGDVPPEVAAVDDVEFLDSFASLVFDSSDPDVLQVVGPAMPTPVRTALDDAHPRGRVQIEALQAASRIPHRGLLLALLSASGLTAAVASSIGTERSRKTLGTLLSAAVTPLEIVLGKWLAWGGMATVSTLAFAAVALARGLIEPGWWLLPMSITPAATVAVGLWSVRSSPDVVSATSTALRIMPTATMATGVGAAALGTQSSLLGAMVPLGGSIAAAGAMWPAHPLRDSVAACVSTGLATLVVLWWTARDLTEHPAGTGSEGWSAVPGAAGLGLLALGCPLVAPQLWVIAGNPSPAEWASVDLASAIASVTLLSGLGALAMRHRTDVPFLDLRRPGALVLVLALLGGVLLALADPLFASAATSSGTLGVLAARSHALLVPTALSAPFALLLILCEELLFRGALAPRIGHGPASTAWALCKAPLDPVGALAAGGVLGIASGRGGLVASIAVRLSWWATAAFTLA